MKKIHDGRILSYQVNFENLKIGLEIEDDREEKIKITFENFFSFHFESQLPDSILLDIIEESVDNFISENEELLSEGKNYYWPMDYDKNEELIDYIKDNNYHYYKIQSSYGLNGWVVCERFYFN
ncbi:hypothetical protein QUF99_05530 [Bacillus sp. DX4.1]|uniref:hypothetical protein n=1 Tax=Bacillus sp. DX4.1 TaxID=3055867 RepID=UPI0025A011C9|nr:hypothetical protein [Bacillus sp. DX4.1]MDM5186833.1 hypothetical protein [Bacillus sp. DX4.1]